MNIVLSKQLPFIEELSKVLPDQTKIKVTPKRVFLTSVHAAKTCEYLKEKVLIARLAMKHAISVKHASA